LGDHRRAGVADDAAADTVDRAFASGGRMKIGIPKEIKDHEFRVGATPSGVKALVETGHEVVIERDAGAAIGFTDELYCAAGAQVPDPEQTQALIDRKVVAIAYETVTDKQGHLPLLVPMSEVAGRLAIQAGAHALQMREGGRC